MKKLVSAAIFLLLSVSLYSQRNSSDSIIKKHEVRIESLENKIIVLEGQKENLDERFQNKSDAIEIEINRIESKLNEDYKYLKFILWVFGAVTVVGIITGAISIYRYIIKKAKEKVDEKFDALFDKDKEKLIKVIDNQILENKLKNEVQISVITPENKDDSYIKKFFNQMDFKKVKYISSNQYFKVEEETKIIFINNESDCMAEELIQEYHDKESRLIFILGSRRIIPEWVSENKVAIANNRIQLYGNLLNAMRYIGVK